MTGKVKLISAGGGSVSLATPSTGSNRTLTLPDADLTIPATNSSGTLTTQGDTLYRDGSGIQRLAKGTAGQVLKMNAGATAPEWGTDVGGKCLQHKYTKTYYSAYTAWPTSETDISGASIAMTKQSSGSSKYIFRINYHIRYQAGSVNGWVKIFKGSSCIDSDMDSNYGMGFLHSPTSSLNQTYSQMWIDDAATDTYKLRHIASSTNNQFERKSWLWFEIMEVEP